jgi:hypothetical protein
MLSVLGFTPRHLQSAVVRLLPVLAALVIAVVAGTASSTPAQTSGSAATPKTPGVVVQQFPGSDLFSVLGQEVKSAKGADMGRIVDVLANQTGQPRAAVIDFGGFLGVGSRRIAVAWRALCFGGAQKHGVVLPDLAPDQLKSAPAYKKTPGKPVAVIAPSTLVASGSDPVSPCNPARSG